jgi:hypothetical protein
LNSIAASAAGSFAVTLVALADLAGLTDTAGFSNCFGVAETSSSKRVQTSLKYSLTISMWLNTGTAPSRKYRITPL